MLSSEATSWKRHTDDVFLLIFPKHAEINQSKFGSLLIFFAK